MPELLAFTSGLGLWDTTRLDCSQSPIFPLDRLDIVRATINGGHLDF